MTRTPIPAGIFCLLLLLSATLTTSRGASAANMTGKFVKYRLSEQVDLPSVFESKISQNVTETILKELSNGSLVNVQIQIANRNVSMPQFFPNGSMIFPILDLTTLNNPNATSNQIRSSFNLTFIQPNTTRTITPFTLTTQQINFNGSSYAGNLYSGTIGLTVNVTRAFNVNQSGIPLLPLNIDVRLLTFPSNLVYNLTATSAINVPFGSSGTGKFQMILLSTNLSLGDPILPLPWYAALTLIIPLGVIGYMIFRRRRAAKRLAQQGNQEKPSYWVH